MNKRRRPLSTYDSKASKAMHRVTYNQKKINRRVAFLASGIAEPKKESSFASSSSPQEGSFASGDYSADPLLNGISATSINVYGYGYVSCSSCYSRGYSFYTKGK